MRLSIVTISYNQGRFLEQAIRSVLDQGYGDLEYIIVDAGSTDGSREIIEKYRRRIATAIFEPDRGPADGLNKGFARATGEIYGYLNADDYFLPGAFERVAQWFRGSNLDVIIGHCTIVDERGAVRRYSYSDRFDLTAYAYGQAQLMQQSTFFRSAFLNKVGGFNSENKVSWDGELLVECGLVGARFATVNELLGAFRVYPESISGSAGLLDAISCEHDRLFMKIMGREPQPCDRRREAWWRIRKHLLNPRNAAQRLLWGPITESASRERRMRRLQRRRER